MPGKGFTPRDIILKNTRQSQAPPTAEPPSGGDAGHPAPGAPDPYTWHYRIQLLPWMHGVEGHAGLPSSLAHASQALGHACPALCRVRVEWRRVLLGPRGSLLPLHRRPSPRYGGHLAALTAGPGVRMARDTFPAGRSHSRLPAGLSRLPTLAISSRQEGRMFRMRDDLCQSSPYHRRISHGGATPPRWQRHGS
jgi:hypothetical protein